MKIFLTGGNGFIGSHLCKRLSELGHVVCEADYNELPVNKLWDCVIHLAAKTTLSKEVTDEFWDSNCVYAHQILESHPRVIYASSTSASELTNPYACTKRYLEHIGQKHGNAVGLRFFNVYGNGCNRGIIKAAIDCANSGNILPLYGGDNIRDFIYIDDVVNWICTNLDKDPGIYDVGTGIGTSINDAVEMVHKITGKDIFIQGGFKSDVDMKVSIANPGMPNCLSLEEGLKKMLCES